MLVDAYQVYRCWCSVRIDVQHCWGSVFACWCVDGVHLVRVITTLRAARDSSVSVCIAIRPVIGASHWRD